MKYASFRPLHEIARDIRSYTTPRFARFAEGDSAGFEKWLKSQPQKVQDDWAANKEKYGDKFKKKAYLDSAIREEVMPMLRIVLAILRAQYLSYQTSHWQTRGPAYYGNHLLFQRLYEGVQAEIDAIGEKLVGYFGIEAVDLEVSLDLVCEMVSRWCSHESHFQRGLTSEGELQDALAIIRNGWPEAHYPLPLGLDDWLAATANAHESNQYLLQQVLGAPASEWPAVMGRRASGAPSGASTLSRLVVKSEEPDIAPAAKANRALMASWLREINNRR